jgi:hypothetical protein
MLEPLKLGMLLLNQLLCSPFLETQVNCIDVFAMPQSGTSVTVEAVDPVFQHKMLEMLKQTGRLCVSEKRTGDVKSHACPVAFIVLPPSHPVSHWKELPKHRHIGPSRVASHS